MHLIPLILCYTVTQRRKKLFLYFCIAIIRFKSRRFNLDKIKHIILVSRNIVRKIFPRYRISLNCLSCNLVLPLS